MLMSPSPSSEDAAETDATAFRAHNLSPFRTPALDLSPSIIQILFEFCPDPYFVFDERGVLECNHAMLELLGYPNKAALVGHHPAEFSPPLQPDGRPSLEKGIELTNKAREEGYLRFDWVHRRRDGRMFPVEVTLIPVQMDGRTVMVAMWHDMTLRSRTEQALRDSEQQFRTLVQNIPGASYRCENDADWTMYFISDGVKELTGYPASDFLVNNVRTYASVIHPDDRGLVEDLVAEGVSNHQPYVMEYRIVRADGRERWVREKGQGVFDRKGDLRWLDGVIFDITDRREAEEQLRAAKDAAESADRAKSEFLANISHEIRTPMTAILGYAELLADPDLNAQRRRECLNTIKRNGSHLLAMINDILDLSRMESGRLAVQHIACDALSILHEAVDQIRPAAEQSGLRVTIDPRWPLPATVKTDSARLRQILLNLAHNAVKFTSRGHVTFTLRCDRFALPHRYRIDVEDTGIGIPDTRLEAIFRPFSQADGSATRPYGGAGLSLCISRRLARALGGDLTVQSTESVGSRFTVTFDPGNLDQADWITSPADEPSTSLPLNAKPGVAAATPPLPPLPDGKLHGRVLFAEDNPDTRNLLSLMLRRIGLTVDVAEHGEQLLDLASRAQKQGTPYDVILTDVQMPRMDGLTATRQLREGGYHWPIVAITAHAMSIHRNQCIDAGCDDYLTKPVQRLRLMNVLRRYMATPA
ncbi:MAG: PAS domain S-box protein [Phycisphaeraceae bacterium]|nr:PAS domain S-box protein [Phycisphaeraceae bacterium]